MPSLLIYDIGQRRGGAVSTLLSLEIIYRIFHRVSFWIELDKKVIVAAYGMFYFFITVTLLENSFAISKVSTGG